MLQLAIGALGISLQDVGTLNHDLDSGDYNSWTTKWNNNDDHEWRRQWCRRHRFKKHGGWQSDWYGSNCKDWDIDWWNQEWQDY